MICQAILFPSRHDELLSSFVSWKARLHEPIERRSNLLIDESELIMTTEPDFDEQELMGTKIASLDVTGSEEEMDALQRGYLTSFFEKRTAAVFRNIGQEQLLALSDTTVDELDAILFRPPTLGEPLYRIPDAAIGQLKSQPDASAIARDWAIALAEEDIGDVQECDLELLAWPPSRLREFVEDLGGVVDGMADDESIFVLIEA